jgi:chorismate mutase
MNFANYSLQSLREQLVKLEDNLIFSLIERNEFKHNPCVYASNVFFEDSFLQFYLKSIEAIHSKVRRYTSPDEYPFTDNLPEPILPPISYPQILYPNTINVNSEILEIYVSEILALVTEEGDDGNYGSSCTIDVQILQTISRRVHLGKFVAEIKFQSNPEEYSSLIRNNDSESIMNLLTDLEVERRVLARLRKKALVYGQEIEESHEGKFRISPDAVVRIYEKFIIPMTKKVELEYLLHHPLLG